MEEVAHSGTGATAKTRWLNLPTMLLLIIILLASFLRLYRLEDYMTFLGDEGRDVLVVKHLLEGDIIGLGPTASVGGFFLGPIYYYFMAPFLWAFRLDPVGPAVMVALFAIATVFLIYWVGKEFFGQKVALVAASLYSIAPLVIAYSRSSWNPNLMPFFSLLTLFLIYKGIEKKKFLFFLFAGIGFGVTMQLHYLTTFLGVIIGVYMFIMEAKNLKRLFQEYALFILGFLIGLSPFLAFEIKHGFPNIRTVVQFMFGNTGETGFAGGKFSAIVGDVFFRLFGRLVTRFPEFSQISLQSYNLTIGFPPFTITFPIFFLYIGTIALGVLSTTFLFYQTFHSFQRKQEDFKKLSLIFLWFFFGVMLFGLYKKPIYDYYFSFMFPLPFLLVGMLLTNLYEWKGVGNAGKIISIGIFVALVVLNLDGVPFRQTPNRQLAQVKQISQFVLDKTSGRPFNFALITLGNSDHAYRYFFELEGNPSVTIENTQIDPQRKTITEQLLIICEDISCKPLGDPLWEVAGFGRAQIEGEWQVSVVKVFKLVHYQGN